MARHSATGRARPSHCATKGADSTRQQTRRAAGTRLAGREGLPPRRGALHRQRLNPVRREPARGAGGGAVALGRPRGVQGGPGTDGIGPGVDNPWCAAMSPRPSRRPPRLSALAIAALVLVASVLSACHTHELRPDEATGPERLEAPVWGRQCNCPEHGRACHICAGELRLLPQGCAACVLTAAWHASPQPATQVWSPQPCADGLPLVPLTASPRLTPGLPSPRGPPAT